MGILPQITPWQVGWCQESVSVESNAHLGSHLGVGAQRLFPETHNMT